LVTVKHLLLKNVKCRNLLENDTGGGSVSGTIPVRFFFMVIFLITLKGTFKKKFN
jgi:hypothetical protein